MKSMSGVPIESNFMKLTEFDRSCHYEEGEAPQDDNSVDTSTEDESSSPLFKNTYRRVLKSRPSRTTDEFEFDKTLINGVYDNDFEVQYAHERVLEDEVEFFCLDYLRRNYKVNSITEPPRRWGIIVRNIKQLHEPLRSGICYVNNIPWRLSLIPRTAGCKEKNEPVLGLFVQCCVNSYSALWTCNAQAEIILKGNVDFKRRTSHFYTSKESDWGYSSFVTFKELFSEKNGYCKSGSIGVEAILNSVKATDIMELPEFREKIQKYRKISEMQRDKGFTDKAIECVSRGIELCEYYSDIKSLRDLLKYKNALINYKLEESIKRIESGRMISTIDAGSIVKVSNEVGKLVNKTARAQAERKKKPAMAMTKKTKPESKCTNCISTGILPTDNNLKENYSELPLPLPSTSLLPSLKPSINCDSEGTLNFEQEAKCGCIVDPMILGSNKKSSIYGSSMTVELERGDPTVIIDLILRTPELGRETERVSIKHEVCEALSVEEVIKSVVDKYEEEWQDDPYMKRFIPELKRVAYGKEFSILLGEIIKNIKRRNLEKLSRCEDDAFYEVLMMCQRTDIIESSETARQVREEIVKRLAEKKKELQEGSSSKPKVSFDKKWVVEQSADFFCKKCLVKVKDSFNDYGERFRCKLMQFLKFVQNYYYSKEFSTAYTSIVGIVKEHASRKGMDEDYNVEEFPKRVGDALEFFSKWDQTKDNPLELLFHFHHILDAVFLPVDSFLPRFHSMTKALMSQNRALISVYDEGKLEKEDMEERIRVFLDERRKTGISVRFLKEENKKYKKRERNYIAELEKYRRKFQSTDETLKFTLKEVGEIKDKINDFEKEVMEKAKTEQSLKDSKKRLQTEVKENQATIKQLREQLEKSKEYCRKLEQKRNSHPLPSKTCEFNRIKQLERELVEFKFKESAFEFEKSMVAADLSLQLIQKRKQEGRLTFEHSRELETQELCWTSYKDELSRYLKQMRNIYMDPTNPPIALRQPVVPGLLSIPPAIVIQKVIEVKPIYLPQDEISKLSPHSVINFQF